MYMYGQTYSREIVDLGDLRVEVDGYVATLYRDGERIGQWQAGIREYAAAGVEWPGCSCGEEPCRHGLAHYWGETLSPVELDALAAKGERAMNYRDLVADDKVQRLAYARRPEGYRFGEAVPGWEGWMPIELTDSRGRPEVVVTVLDNLTERERKVVEAWTRLDEIAAEREVDPDAPAWEIVRRMQRYHLRMALEASVTAKDLQQATEDMPRDDAALIRAYAVALDDPDEAIRMTGPEYDAAAALGRMLGESAARAADRWRGGDR